jgi:hypothetical protein
LAYAIADERCGVGKFSGAFDDAVFEVFLGARELLSEFEGFGDVAQDGGEKLHLAGVVFVRVKNLGNWDGIARAVFKAGFPFPSPGLESGWKALFTQKLRCPRGLQISVVEMVDGGILV